MKRKARNKKLKVIERKLGRHRAWGLYYDNTIELDERMTGKRRLVVTNHEYFHYLFPEMSESKVDRLSAKLAGFLWSQGYRRFEK